MPPAHEESAPQAATEVLEADADGIRAAAELLRDGELVAFPTETVYGLGACAFDEEAVGAVFRAKGRPSTDPLIVHVAGVGAAEALGDLHTDGGLARMLVEAFWPGPLTVVVPRSDVEGPGPRLATAVSPTQTVGLRCPAHDVALELLRTAGVPVAAPSANRFGRVSPTSAEHVLAELGGRIRCVLDGGSTPLGVESTVVGVGEAAGCPPGSVRLLRPGGVPLEDLVAVLPPGTLEDLGSASVDPGVAAHSPGTSVSHYAPEVPVVFTVDTPGLAAAVAAGLRSRGLRAVELPLPEATEAARGLYSLLRGLDEPPTGGTRVDAAVISALPPEGLGRAVNDRLLRAAHGHLQHNADIETIDGILERIGVPLDAPTARTDQR